MSSVWSTEPNQDSEKIGVLLWGWLMIVSPDPPAVDVSMVKSQ